ncbi:MAG: YdcF family protein [Proteobacteria bacterium]|nr:YdcF family protein [Pseudomonadota bacterium]MDA1325054.1 YdcF family protein [Pseudomonadota bacterium]
MLSKIFNFFLHPGLWIGFLLLAGTVLLWTRWRKTGRWILSVMMAFIVLVTAMPVGLLMIEPLENRFPVVTKFSGPIDGIIVLGGTVRQLMTKYRGQPSLTDGAERLTEFIALAKQYPKAKLAFSGGSGLLLRQDVKETETARLFFAQMGLDTTRVVFEDESRNTYENALYCYKLLSPKPQERWVLITSASHMPRAVGSFRKAGWTVTPFPVDFSTYGPEQRQVGFNMMSGIGWFGTALRAWSGLLVYRVLGRTDTLFPAPDPAPDRTELVK